ncbi:hypothetical protein STENM36S_07924 [Streptomyces tendae]
MVLPLPRKPMLTGLDSRAANIRARCQAPGVTVVALLPSAGPVPPPMRVVMPDARASSTAPGAMKWTWVSMPPAVTILPLPAMISVSGPMTRSGWTPSMVSGLLGLADAGDPSVADADVGLDDAPVVDDQGPGDHGVGCAFGAGGAGLPHGFAQHLAAAEDGFVAGAAGAAERGELVRVRALLEEIAATYGTRAACRAQADADIERETVLDARQALEYGLVDRIVPGRRTPPASPGAR